LKRNLIWLAAVGHTITDLNFGAIPSLLPYFITEYGLSYAAAATFLTACSISSSVVQPLFGYLADRVSTSWLIPVGILLAGYGTAASGIAPVFGLSVSAIALSGIGIAAFHPEGARLVHRASGEKKAEAMSLFSVGGQVGFALGPALATSALTLWGLKGTLVLSAPATIMALIFFTKQGEIKGYLAATGEQEPKASSNAKTQEAWVAFGFLTATLIFRSILFYGLNAFVPLYWIHVLHQSKAAGGTALTMMFTAGVIGNLSGGRLADRYGNRKVILVGYGVLTPLLFLLPYTRNSVTATALIILIGGILLSIFSPLIVLGQKYLPNRVGLASGVTLGIAVAVGGIASPFLGRFADHHGIPSALRVVAFLSLLAWLTALPLPDPRPRETST
jgi:FSR family fosmidomycin resistance protein-like MFS transporter